VLLFDLKIERRKLFREVALTSIASLTLVTTSRSSANAAPFGNAQRRQLELCLVTLLRVRYWCEIVSRSIQDKIDNAPSSGATDATKAPYLEARLGAKALLTGKAGGGANSRVYKLATFQIRGCVKDAEKCFNDYYKMEAAGANSDERKELKRRKAIMSSSSLDITENLAALVEFDGLDNVQDPSPRSSLALTKYTKEKALFVKRLLLEREIPALDSFLTAFGTAKRLEIEKYVRNTYPNETPQSLLLQ